jgi:hypothetical protein
MLWRTRLTAPLLLACTWSAAAQQESASWQSVLRNAGGQPVSSATVVLVNPQRRWEALTGVDGKFRFTGLAAGRYAVEVRQGKRSTRSASSIEIRGGEQIETGLQLASDRELLLVPEAAATAKTSATGGERLSSRDVSGLPLNGRDFSQLLLLASGTQTDTNGANNFTQQFAVNGQRGTAAVFSIDGIDATDPEMGGASFSNFNVDAIQEIRSNSGVMPAEIGHGAATFTDVITKSGSDQVHGAIFEFVRNAAFDARNFFDRRSIANPGRLPPFVRNEFGFTNGGPVVIPGVYDGRGRTFYFGQYQGFRQILGTTQVIPVPTPGERRGLDTTAFSGDTLLVPVNPQIAAVMSRYPLPNDPQGPYGARTYATSSKVGTFTDQFSVRIDHRISSKGQLFARFNFNNVDGPLTNPSQTAVDPSFAIRFLDRQRNFGLTYTRNVSAHLTLESAIGYERTTPLFAPVNHVQPALTFDDGLYEAFNAPGGTVAGVYGNVFQARQNVVYVHGSHSFKAGFEARANRDTAVFGLSPNGDYTFGGGTAYSPVEIPSRSGLHNIQAGDPLPDALTGFLTGTPFSYQISIAPSQFPQGDHIGWSAIHREAYSAYFQDTWKATPKLSVSYGLRYEVTTPLREPTDRASGPAFLPTSSGIREALLVNLQPTYHTDWSGWGPRLSLEWSATSHLLWHVSGSIVTILPTLFQTNFDTGGAPFVITTYLSAAPSSPVAFENAVSKFNLPTLYTPQGAPVFATGRSTDVPRNTEIDVQRFENDLAAVTSGHQIRPLTVFGNDQNFRNGYMATYTAGFDQDFSDLKLSAAYVATVGVGLAGLYYPNSYGGAAPAFAPFTTFDSAGRVLGGYGPEFILTNRSHSSFHSLQTGLQKTSARFGLGFQASYTFSKALDDDSSVLGGFANGSSGTLQGTAAQNPWNLRADKGPSTFDVTHVGTLSLVQDLPFDRWLRPSGVRALFSGWQLFGTMTLSSGLPFTIYSGIQQTGVGADSADRPDQTGRPVLSTSRTVREDYFGLGAANGSFFSIPINVPGGTGPNHGRFGTLGRDTFRGPAFHNFDVSLIKETPLPRERFKVQFRAEIFNVFNLVNFGLPANILLGPGFGVINRTSGTSRQIQLSLKLLY